MILAPFAHQYCRFAPNFVALLINLDLLSTFQISHAYGPFDPQIIFITHQLCLCEPCVAFTHQLHLFLKPGSIDLYSTLRKVSYVTTTHASDWARGT